MAGVVGDMNFVVAKTVDFLKSLDFSTLTDKSVLITGGVSGLGALIATAFAEHGARVTVADINEELGKNFVKQQTQLGSNLRFVRTDVTSWQSQIEAFKTAIRFSGHNGIDIVVAAAGLSGDEFHSPDEEPSSLETDPPEPRIAGPTFDVNAKGVYFTAHLAKHYFHLPETAPSSTDKAFRKSLILISSLAGYLEINAADYTASKWAVRGLFRSIRSRMEDLGYRTNLIAPWVMDTPMSKGLASICRENGLPVGNAKHVAQAVLRCAADDAICGRAIAVGATQPYDLNDDIEGMNAGIVMKDYLEGEAKEFMAFFGQRP
ncbi:hypothetical protein ACLMJK_002538 [Lecanora helva]